MPGIAGPDGLPVTKSPIRKFDVSTTLDALEHRYDVHRYDARFKVVFDATRELMKPPVPKGQPASFRKD